MQKTSKSYKNFISLGELLGKVSIEKAIKDMKIKT